MKIKKLLHALILGLVVAITGSLKAVVLFSDNYTVSTGTYNLDFENTLGREAGSLFTLPYMARYTGASAFLQQLGNTTAFTTTTNVLFLRGDAGVRIDNDFSTVGAPIEIKWSVIMNWYGYANSNSLTIANRSDGYDPTNAAFAFHLRRNGTTAIYDHGVATAGTTGSSFGENVLVDYKVVLSDTAGTGSAFGSGGSKAAYYQSGVLLGTRALNQLTAGQGYIGFVGGVGNVGIDNLQISSIISSPTITLTDTLTGVDTIYGTASPTPTSFHISGNSLTGNLAVTPPSGYEVSTSSGSSYTTSLTLIPSSGTLASTLIYVRLAATTVVGTYSGNITVSGGGASSQNIATAASTVYAAPTVTSFTLMYPGAGGPVPGYDPITNNATINVSVTGTNVSVRANTSPGNDFGSVVFNLTGATTQSQIDNTYPWSLFGDSGGNYTGAVFNVGAHTLTATPYPADGGAGSAGVTAAINFTITNSIAVYPPPGYGLVWSDEFNGSTLDTTKWGYENPGKWRDGYNTPNAVSVTNGLLTITTYSLNGTNFTCELNTYNKFMPKYGYMEASIDFNDSPGMWSAFWLYNYGVPTVGNPKTNGVEVDMIEHLAHNGSDVDVSGQGVSTLHWDGYGASHRSVTSGAYNSNFATGFHTCALLWTPDAYKIIMDGVVVWTTTNAPAQDPVPPASPVSQIGEFLLLSSEVWSNNWVGTTPPGGYGSLATSTTKMKVDYVRYYQLTAGSITLADTLTAVNSTYGTASPTPTSFHVSGSFLTGNLTVTPPSGYEVSTNSGSGYTTSLTLTPSGGTLPSTQIYVRLTATGTVSESPYSGNITVSGGGATSKTIATVASTVSAKAASVTAVPLSKSYGDVNPLLTAFTNGAINGDVINVSLATDATQFSSVGVSNITVTLGSNPNYNVLTTGSTLTINPAGTTMALVSDKNPAQLGEYVTFTATVSSGAGTPTGNVTFKDGISTLSTGVLDGSAQAVLGIATLAPGNHSITAEYTGGGNFSSSTTNPALIQVINTRPVLSFVTTGGGLQLSWDAPGYVMQQAAGCTGPWTNLVPAPVSPMVITPTNPAAYYRLFQSAP